MGKYNKSSFAFYLIQVQLGIYSMPTTTSLVDTVHSNTLLSPYDDTQYAAVKESVYWGLSHCGVEKCINIILKLHLLICSSSLPPSFPQTLPWTSYPSISSVQFSSVTQSCPTLCNPMNRSMPGLPVHHQLPEFTQTHAPRVSDVIQPSHPLLSPSPPAPNPSQHQGLFQWVNSAWGGQSIGVSTSTSVLPTNTQDWSPLGWTGWISLQSEGLSRVFSNTTVQKHQ